MGSFEYKDYFDFLLTLSHPEATLPPAPPPLSSKIVWC